jgi:acetylornithine deacetylase
METVIDTLSRLVSFETVSSKECASLAAFLAERFEALGMRIEIFEDQPGKVNLVATAGPAGTDGLILSGHMDVVPVTDQAWDSDPFTLRRGNDKRLYGRGTTDMKGFLADVVQALPRIDLKQLKKELMLIFTHDEEVGCIGSAKIAQKFLRDDRPVPTSAVIGEPTDFKMLRMHNGHSAFRIITTGVDGHSSKPDLGANAIQIAARAIVELEEFAQELKKERRFEEELERPYVVINPGIIHGGNAVNIIPARCEVTVGFRPLPDQDAEEVFAQIKERLLSRVAPYAKSLQQGAGLDIILDRVSPAMLTPKNTPLEAVLRDLADDPKTAGCPFCTDAGNFQKIGVRSLIFGPGSIDQAHRPNEFIEEAQLIRGVEVVEKLVRRWCVG